MSDEIATGVMLTSWMVLGWLMTRSNAKEQEYQECVERLMALAEQLGKETLEQQKRILELELEIKATIDNHEMKQRLAEKPYTKGFDAADIPRW